MSQIKSTTQPKSCPLTLDALLDRDFVAHRAMVLDVAAYLDRMDRSVNADTAKPEARLDWLHQALHLLADNQGDKAKRIQTLLSDLSLEPLAKSPGKGATGAPVHFPEKRTAQEQK